MFKFCFSLKKIERVWPILLGLILIAASPRTAPAEVILCNPDTAYEAPIHITPPAEAPATKLRLKENKDGTLTDLDTGLMWVHKDSYADLNQCLNYSDSRKYVDHLTTGEHKDWRIPTLRELASIYDETQENVMAWDHDPEYPLALDSRFADGAAYWYWTSDTGTTPLTRHCAKTLYFVTGIIKIRRFELCNNGGVRAVRKTH